MRHEPCFNLSVDDWKGRGWGRIATLAAALAATLVAGPAHAEWSAETLGGMSVQVYAPGASSPVGDGRALMLVLHGCTQSAGVLRDEGNLEPAADSLGVVMAVPDVPGGGVIAGCWDYYGPLHTRTSSHNGPVLDMVEQLLADPELSIDPDQVYVVGLSSGGGEALVLGCVAPDIFAGVGVIAGPSLGTASSEIGFVSTTAAQSAALCDQLAGDQVAALQTQAAFTFADSADFTVSTGYNAVNAEMFGLVYADGLESMDAAPLDMAELPGPMPAGVWTTYADAGGVRVAQLDSTAGEGHAWPSGSGVAGGLLTYVNGNGLNMAQFATEFFATHNPRAGGWVPPGAETEGSTSAGESGDVDPTDPGAAESSSSASTTGEPDPIAPTDADSSDALPTNGGASGTSEESDASGCSVSSGAPAPGPGTALGLLLLLLRRRRSRVPSV